MAIDAARSGSSKSVAGPSGEHVADEAARVLVDRLQGGSRQGSGEAQRVESRT
ncbi:MAG TPA: hypothetical protein VFH48_08660 [Chloroflexota bacterium]|nr:hypothetical protein [Chloroflexota bacterium]